MKTSQKITFGIESILNVLTPAQELLLFISLLSSALTAVIIAAAMFNDAAWIIRYSKSQSLEPMNDWIAKNKSQKDHANDHMAKEISRFSFSVFLVAFMVLIAWVMFEV